ncbi:peptidylprolyl isomerase [Altererythrobacter sp. ZODW24]|uniref:peptidylprolyl isomerase n=1 Tax=Altererythrobacter sp. ZODW24 TaxID=2185142 RepID=UPI000DF81F86|nr:peptidylprolyl isomerase [Altererythrobacter sp. ZODW24]
MTLPGWTREPLVHFLFGGLLLFAFFAWRGEDVDPASRSIDISREQQARIALQFERTMQRAPTDGELDALVDQYVREEVLYREALRLGLNNDDAVVRKRMAQKMDYLAASRAETQQPSDATLQAWLDEHPARFAPDSRFSFDQLWFAEKSAADAAKARLDTEGRWQDLGERISLPSSLDAASRSDVTARFGSEFAANLEGGAKDEWIGPVRSGFGFHLVRLRDATNGPVPPLAEIRDRVENDWRAETMAKRRGEAFAILRDAYDVTLEQ